MYYFSNLEKQKNLIKFFGFFFLSHIKNMAGEAVEVYEC